jgi:hypothetical protein
MIPAVLRTALAAALLLWATLTVCSSPAAAVKIIVTDLGDKAYELETIPAGTPTLLFVCDPALTRCREGAVHFDTQAARIEKKRIKPVCILLADPETARDAATRLGLTVPVYVDATRMIPGVLLGQEILPAMVLLDGRGKVVRVVLGGGESLDSNLTRILEGDRRPWRILSILIPLAIFGIILLVG